MRKNHEHRYKIIERHRTAWLIVFFGFIVFLSCCIFPLTKYTAPKGFGLLNTALYIIAFVELGSFLPYLKLANGHTIKNLLCCLCAVLIGLGCRYLLELGEISNVYNFTLANMTSFVAGAMLLITVSYVYDRHYAKSGASDK